MKFGRFGAVAIVAIASVSAFAKPKVNPVTDGFAGLACNLGGAAKLYKTPDDPKSVIGDLADGASVDVIDGVVLGGRPQVWPEKEEDQKYVRFKVKADGKIGWVQPVGITCSDDAGGGGGK